MKKRVRQMLNFFAFNCLFFALYLNFIQKDNDSPATFTTNSSVLASSVAKKTETGNKKILSSPEETVSRKAR